MVNRKTQNLNIQGATMKRDRKSTRPAGRKTAKPLNYKPKVRISLPFGVAVDGLLKVKPNKNDQKSTAENESS